jgi:hypothetical protein
MARPSERAVGAGCAAQSAVAEHPARTPQRRERTPGAPRWVGPSQDTITTQATRPSVEARVQMINAAGHASRTTGPSLGMAQEPATAESGTDRLSEGSMWGWSSPLGRTWRWPTAGHPSVRTGARGDAKRHPYDRRPCAGQEPDGVAQGRPTERRSRSTEAVCPRTPACTELPRHAAKPDRCPGRPAGLTSDPPSEGG